MTIYNFTSSVGDAESKVYYYASTIAYGVIMYADGDDVALDLEVVDRSHAASGPIFPRKSISERCLNVEFYLTALLSGSLCLVGLVGAILSFVGLRRDPSMSPAASFILQALACADAVLLSSWLLALSIPATLMYAEVDQTLSAFWIILHRVIGHPTLFIGQTTVAWLTVLVAIGRWATIRFPFRAAGPVCSKTVVRGAVAGVVFASVLFNAPRFFRERPGIHWRFVDGMNITHYRLNKTEMASTDSYKFVYAHVLYSIINFGIPYLLLTVFSALLIAAYRAQCRRRKAMLSPKQHHHDKEGGDAGNGSSTHHDNEHSTTLVVVAIVATFGVCNFPAKIFSLVMYKQTEWKTECSHPLYVMYRLFTFLELANSIGNFIVYCALRHQFRQALIFGAKRRPATKTASPRGSHHPHQLHTAISEVRDDGLVTTAVYNKR